VPAAGGEEEGLMTKAFSTETKKAPAAGEKGPLEGCTTKRKGDGAEAPAPAQDKKLLMPEENVAFILSRKRGVFAPHKLPQLSKETMESMADGVEAFNHLRDSFYKMQAEIRAEFDAKGYVEVVDDYFERREEYRQMVEEQLADLFDGIVFTEDELSKD
jgi:hypothetical protein